MRNLAALGVWLVLLAISGAAPAATILRASDGKVVFTNPAMGIQTIPSPVVEGDTILQLSNSMQLFVHEIPAAFADPLKLQTRSIKVETPFPKYFLTWHLSSPLVHHYFK